MNYSYSKDKITSTGYVESSNATGVYNLDGNNRVTNGTITKANNEFEKSVFTYDSSGYLTKMVVSDDNGYTDTYKFEISNGNITSIIYENNYAASKNWTVNISYSTIENKAEIYFWDLGFLPNDIFYNYPALQLQGYLGKATKNLPSMATTTGGFTGVISKVLTNDGGAVTPFTISAKDGDNDAEILNYVVSYK